ncbi:MAG: hypothetical protein KA257_01965 [Opitutaceae bacterium]|nr:hypothetical protein [Opitutaceae bacterium]MBP9912232.1 hypothetical protein [Opitutaceae bacterium]
MKKSSLFVLSVLATGLTLALPVTRAADAAEKAAQPEGGPREHLADRLKMLAEKLTLTDAQKASAGEVLKHEAAKLKALRDDAARPRREKFKEMRTIREETRTQLRALFTPEQQATFDAMPQRGPGGRGGPEGRAGGES